MTGARRCSRPASRAAHPPPLTAASPAPRTARSGETLALFQPPSSSPASRQPGPGSGHQPSRQLWVYVGLPQLAVEVLPADGRPTAVVAESRGRRSVVACDGAAARAGVRPGLSRDGARALEPGLRIVEQLPRRETAAVERLAHWALQFSPVVNCDPPEGLCLEVRGSLRLFGGLGPLLAQLEQGLRQLGHEPRLGTAPTATAARVLARAGRSDPVTGSGALAAALGPLSVRHLAFDARLVSRLRGMGLRRIADLARLPRDGLSRRIGRRAMQTLDRALGRSPDPREAFEPPARFRAVADLGQETGDMTLVEQTLAGLVTSLSGFLLARQCGIQRLALSLRHLKAPPTRVTVGLASPAREHGRLMAVVRERLARVALSAPVVEVGLASGPLMDLATPSGSLFAATVRDAPGTEAGPALPELVERLRARLGAAAVSSLRRVPDHRPERAWQRMEPAGAGGETSSLAAGQGPRPLWLLRRPELLATRDGRLWLDGPLALEAGPERIESGWWDGGDVSRDYYVARDQAAARFWVFRERRGARRWFLHGIFA